MLTPDGRLIAVGNFDSSGLTAVLDYMRIALAQAVTLSCERIQKLLSRQHSDLPTGLRAHDDIPQDGFAIFGHGAASLAAEARLLAQPVSLELPTSSIAESIEDRVTMSSLAAHRLDEQSALAIRLAVVELICASQAMIYALARYRSGLVLSPSTNSSAHKSPCCEMVMLPLRL